MPRCLFFFFFNDTATTEIYTLSLHDALPIWDGRDPRGAGHLRQLPARDADPGGLDPPPPARGGGGDDRRGRGDPASGRPQEAAAASAHRPRARAVSRRSEEHTSELQSQSNLV